MTRLLFLALALAQSPGPTAGAPTGADSGVAMPATTDTLDVSAPLGRDAIESLTFPPLLFDPPAAAEHEIAGVPVFHLHDPTLPLVDVQLQLTGGTSHFPRDELGAVSAFPFVLRSGGTVELPADSVDRRIDLLALQLSFGAGGGGTVIGLNSLTQTLAPGMALLRELLLQPALHPEALEVWRGQALERVRRREDNPSGLAIAEFNRLMYGGHPVGWVMDESDLSPTRLHVEALRSLHSLLICRDRLILGISGDVTWEQAEPLVRAFVEPWPDCPGRLPAAREPVVRRGRGVFILPRDIEQSTVIMAQAGGVRQEDSSQYFASQIANHLLGASGFSSRIMSRGRSDEGLAYGASSVWTTPLRYEGLLGALTATGAEATIEVTSLLFDILQDFRDSPPSQEQVRRAVEEITTGYVFAFESPSQVVARQMLHRAQGLPDGWFARYLGRLEEVTAEDVASVVREHLDPAGMTILLVGDPARFDVGLEGMEPVYEVLPGGVYRSWVSLPAVPGGSPRSRP